MEANNKISLAWKNLGYEINKKIILRDLNGSFEYHALNGLMGPSGSGKTTFINAFIKNLKLTPSSQLYIDNDSPTMAYVSQHIHQTIIGKMKVQDILTYAFKFKNNEHAFGQIKKHINFVIDELMLDVQVLERKFENCSGGEQERIAIAQELMSLKQPSFLFIDEPTTGLDSNSAFSVMKCLRKLAQDHRITIIASIHSPNTDILNLFDKLYILSRGGVCIYSATPTLLKQNLKQKLQIELSNEKPPIEEYLRIACKGVNNEQVDELFQQTMQQETENLQSHLINFKKFSGLLNERKQFDCFHLINQMKRLFSLNFWWNLKTFLAIIVFYIFFMSFLASVYGNRITWPSGCQKIFIDGSNETCFKRLSLDELPDTWIVYQFLATSVFGGFAITISSNFVFFLMKVFQNEHLNRWYSLSVFYWSLNAVYLVESFIYSGLVVSLIYFTTDMMYVDDNRFNWIRFMHFLVFYWLLCVYLQAWGQLISAVFKNLILCAFLSQFFAMVLNCFNTFLIIIDYIDNDWINFVSNFLALRFLFEGIIYSMYGISRCDPDHEFSFVLRKYGIEKENVYFNAIRVVMNIFVIKILIFFVMFLDFNTKFNSKNIFWFLKNTFFTSNDNNSNDFKLDSNMIQMEKETEFEKFTRDKIHVAWRSLSLFDSESISENQSIHNKHSNLILRNLNGQFKFQTMNALMGTSGSGKTSFLRVLNGQFKTRLSEESSIFLSKYTPTRTCFLNQKVSNHLIPGLTAKQSLIYASKLKNIHEINQNQIDHQKIASNLLKELDIENTAQTMVQRCSGGERKRLALALELTALRMPNLICIDEPTSGLDSNSAEVVIACLSRYVHRHNITLIVSIHQPNATVMMMFDTIYMLARGGVCIYSGFPNQIKNHLQQVPDTKFSEDSFAVEELIKYSCLDHQQTVVQKLVQENQKQDYQLNDDIVFSLEGIPINRPRFLFKSIYFLLMRRLVCIRQYSWIYVVVLFFSVIVFGVFIRFLYPSSVFKQSGCIDLEEDFNTTCLNNDQFIREMDLYHGFTYIVLLSTIFLSVAASLCGNNFLFEIAFYFNENHNGWYSTLAYYLTESIYDIFLSIPLVIIFSLIVDVYISIKPGFFFISASTLFIGLLSLQGLAQITVLLTNRQYIILVPSGMLILHVKLILGNIFMSIERMHYFYQIFSNFSTFRFINETFALFLYGFERCSSKQISAILYQMGLHHDEDIYHCIWILLCQVLLYRMIAFILLLYYSNKGKKNYSRKMKLMDYHLKNLSEPLNCSIPGLSSAHSEFRMKIIQV